MHMADNTTKNDDTDILVTLDLDDGSQVECEILTTFTADERDYIALLPLGDDGRAKCRRRSLYLSAIPKMPMAIRN